MAARKKQPKKNEAALARPAKALAAPAGGEFDEVVAWSTRPGRGRSPPSTIN